MPPSPILRIRAPPRGCSTDECKGYTYPHEFYCYLCDRKNKRVPTFIDRFLPTPIVQWFC